MKSYILTNKESGTNPKTGERWLYVSHAAAEAPEVELLQELYHDTGEGWEWENWLYGRLDDKRLATLKDYLDNDPRADNLLDAVFSSQAGETLIDLPQEKA